MKVLMINGSPRKTVTPPLPWGRWKGSSQEEGIQVETVQLGAQDIRGCIACLSCKKKGRCVFDDLVNQTAP